MNPTVQCTGCGRKKEEEECSRRGKFIVDEGDFPAFVMQGRCLSCTFGVVPLTTSAP